METAESIAMLRLLSGYWFSQALYVVAALGVADHLCEGAKTADLLASELGADSDALYRLLRALSSAGIFTSGPRGFELTPLSETLRSDRADSLRAVALLGGHPLHWQAWGKLLDSVRTGKTAFELAHGQRFFDALGQDRALSDQFQRILGRSSSTHRGLIEVMGLHRFRRIVDVGGGSGSFAQSIAAALPQARVILFDRPEVVGAVPPSILFDAVSGDFFELVPHDADAYILKFVLHDWADADVVRILSRCQDAMTAHARLFVAEVFVPEDATPSIAKTHDVNMLALTGGRERTLEQYRRLVNEAKMTIISTVITEQGLGVIEVARPAVGASA
jgi:hypothetical protein